MKIKQLLIIIIGIILLKQSNCYALNVLSLQQYGKTGALYANQAPSSKENKTSASIRFQDAIDILYKKYQISIASNQSDIEELTIAPSLLELPSDKIEEAMRKFLERHQFEFRRVSSKQFLILKVQKNQQREEKPKKYIGKETGNLYKVSGTVRDQLGQALSGVSVHVAGTQRGTLTNANGKYIIEVEPTAVLEFSFVGYKKQSQSVRNRVDINVTMEPIANSLQEVAVVGYGRQKKASVVGSQSTIKPAELKLPVGDLTTALAGRLAGLVATQRSGGPGQDGASLLIRGVSTYDSSPQGPLLVVDGVPDRSISNIDPEDVASITILKDASATAVYGTRGANGVILINTKKGKPGKPQINVEADQALTQFTRLPSFVDGPTYMQLYNEALSERGRTPIYTQSDIDKTKSGVDPDLYPNVNWFKTLFNNYGSNNRVTVNVNGGSENASYYLSVGYFGETGMFKRDPGQTFNSTLKLDRFNFTSNLTAELTKTTRLEFGINGYITNLTGPSYGVNDIFSLAGLIPSVAMPVRYSNGQWPQPPQLTASPLMYLTETGYTKNDRTTIRSNLRVTQNLDMLTKGLSLTGMFAFDVNASDSLNRSRTVQTYWITDRSHPRDAQGNLVTQISQPGFDNLGYFLGRYEDRRLYAEASANYARKFGEHEVGGLLLFNQSDFSDASKQVDSWKKTIPYRQRNLVGRATYGYQGKYFAEANFSYSGSEAFIPSKRYGFFPSIGAGWLISNEKFFKPIKTVLSYLKVRYSYGLSGNANLNDANKRFLYLTTLGTGTGYSFGDTPSAVIGYDESQIGGQVSWETAKRQNLGLEFNFLKDDLQFIAEIFQERRTGILLPNYIIPYNSGYTTGNIPYSNVGETKNKGIDLTIQYNKTWTAENFFTFRGTFNYNKNLAVKDGLPPWKYAYENRVGLPISQRFGYVALGYFKDQNEIDHAAKQSGDVRPGDIRYKDLNGDGLINSYDQTAIGYGDIPRIVYGLSFGGAYHGFDLTLFFQGAAMVDFNYAVGNGTVPFPNGNATGNLFSTMLDRWTVDNPNPNAFYPRLSTNQDNSQNYVTSTHWIKNANYLRLKSAEFGYTFKIRALRKLAIQRLRIFTNGTNLLTFSRWKFWDPELGDQYGGVAYPNTTAYNLGLRINFQ